MLAVKNAISALARYLLDHYYSLARAPSAAQMITTNHLLDPLSFKDQKHHFQTKLGYETAKEDFNDGLFKLAQIYSTSFTSNLSRRR